MNQVSSDMIDQWNVNLFAWSQAIVTAKDLFVMTARMNLYDDRA